jgi:hypothetical protein
LHRKLDSVCLDTRAKAKEEFKVRFQQFKVRFQLALDTKDAAQLCELLEGPGDSQAYDVDVGNDIIVRCHRKIVYPNGTVYIGFVDTATGLPDGEGSVTQEDIRKKEAAAQVLKTQLFNLCEENKRKTAKDLRTLYKDALGQKNTR